jgi:glucose-6-phosphate 1-epimerase
MMSRSQPIFGPPPSSPPEYASLSQHGFARTQIWTLEKVVMDRKEGVSIRLIAPSPPESFPHSYRLNYVVTLTAHQLSTDIHLLNNGDKDFMFQALLHNYLAVPDSSKISISGLDSGTKYYDKAGGGKMAEWAGGPLRIDKEVDS